MDLRRLLLVSLLGSACSAGTGTDPQVCECAGDAGCNPSSGADYEVQLRFVNLGREVVFLQLDGEEGEQAVASMASVAKVGHTSLTTQSGTVRARNFLDDGSKEPVVLSFEFDTTDDEPVTVVVADASPERISMNVTVAKQTQGVDFGQRMQAGLQSIQLEGGVDIDGDCLADDDAHQGMPARVGLYKDPPDDDDCPGTADRIFVRPAEADADATPYFVRGPDGDLQVAWLGKVNAGLHAAGSAVASGASLLGGALPGGALISARVPSLYVLNAHAGKVPVTVAIEGVDVVQDLNPGALARVPTWMVAAAARASFDDGDFSRRAVASITADGVTSSVELGAARTDPCRLPYLCDFLGGEDTLLVVSENLDSSATVLKARQDARKSLLGVVRREVVFATTSTQATEGCAAVFATDDTCVMGAAFISSVGSLAGGGSGAAAASYAATGRLLYPPKSAQRFEMMFNVRETGAAAERFTWIRPAGLTPGPENNPQGFAIVAAGSSVDATAPRALFFVSTAVEPWVVQASLAQ